MTVCPVAIAVGCKKCPVVGFCPLKSVIGDYGKEKDEGSQSSSVEADSKQDKE